MVQRLMYPIIEREENSFFLLLFFLDKRIISGNIKRFLSFCRANFRSRIYWARQLSYYGNFLVDISLLGPYVNGLHPIYYLFF